MVLDSICRIRSRVTPYTLPISSRVLGCPSVSPNRMETTPASRSDSVPSTECSCSCSSVKLTASPGWIASESSRSEEHTSELQSLAYLVCRLLLEKKKKNIQTHKNRKKKKKKKNK